MKDIREPANQDAEHQKTMIAGKVRADLIL